MKARLRAERESENETVRVNKWEREIE
jgi:hypothetical protein